MTIEVPKHCRRLVRAYEGQDYVLVPSEHPRHLLKLTLGGYPTVYITMGRSPLSLVNRDPDTVASTGNKVPHYSAVERKHAQFLVFGGQEVESRGGKSPEGN